MRHCVEWLSFEAGAQRYLRVKWGQFSLAEYRHNLEGPFCRQHNGGTLSYRSSGAGPSDQ